MGGVLTWILSGLAAGWLVRFVIGSRREFGVVGDLTLGTLGGLVGGWLFKHLGVTEPDGGVVHVFVAVAGAATLVGAVRLLRKMVVVGASVLPPSVRLDVDVEKQMRTLTDFDRGVLTRMLKRKPTANDPNQVFDAQLTFGQRVADQVALFGGSWTFIGLFFLALAVWMMVQGELAHPFDPYPYILLNLVLSCVAALQAPVIMMSQNRQAVKDRVDARNDYEVNLRAEMEIMGLHAKLDAVREREWAEFMTLQRDQLEALQRIERRLLQPDHRPGDEP